MKTIRTALILFTCLVTTTLLDAQNLVPNPSFENFTSCPTTLSELPLAQSWNTPTGGTSDYYHSCNGGNIVGVPINFAGTEPAHTGDAYAGLIPYASIGATYREYIQVQLTQPLDANNCYTVSMWVSLAENSNFATNNLGIYLSNTAPTDPGVGVLNLNPQIVETAVISNSNGWELITAEYIAVGGEQFVTIGCFVEDNLLNIVPVANNLSPFSYYFIDDVEVVPGGGGLIAEIVPPDVLDCNTSSVLLDASGSSSGAGLTYQWTGPNGYTSNLVSPTVTEPGIYTLIISQGLNNCQGIADVEVILDNIPPDVAIDADDPDILNCDNTSVILTGSSSDAGATYSWQGQGQSSSTPTLETSLPGNYQLTIIGSNGCTNTEDITIDQDLIQPDVEIISSGIIDCNNDVAVLAINTTSIITGYQWTGPTQTGNTETLIANEAGLYTLVVTGENGCTTESQYMLFEDVNLPIADAGPVLFIGCSGDPVTLDGSGSSVGNNINYEWQDLDGSTLGNDITLEVNEEGIYIFIVTNANTGCVSMTQGAVIPDNNIPLAVIESDGDLDCTNTMVELSINGSSSGANIFYEWFDDTNTSLGSFPTIMVDESGTYTLVVTNLLNSCSASNDVIVDVDVAPPIAEAGDPTTIDCGNTAVTLDGSNSSLGTNINYSWIDPDGLPLGNDVIQMVNEAGTYELLVTNIDNGCTAIDQVIVTPDTNFPVAVADADSELACDNDMVSLSASGSTTGTNIQYEWFDDTNTSLGMTATIDVGLSGTYTLVVTNLDNSCTADNQVIVLEDFATPTSEAGDPAVISCGATEAALDGSASSSGVNISYEWFDENGVSISNDIMINVDQVGTYDLIVTNLDNGCTAIDQVIVTPDLNLPLAAADADSELACNNDMVTLSATGSSTGTNIQYEWFDDTNTSLGLGATINVSQSGIFTLVVTNLDNGCSANNDAIVLDDFTAPSAVAGDPGLITCGATEATLDGSGSSSGTNINYQWFDEDGVFVSNDVIINVDEVGTYELLVTNLDNGCTAIDQVIVTPDLNLPLAAADADSELACNNDMVGLSANGSSTGANIQYEWFDDTNTSLGLGATIEVGQSGTFTLVVTNVDNGCSADNQVIVLEDFASPNADAGNPTQISCGNTEAALDGSNSSTGTNINYEWFDENGVSVSNDIMINVDQVGTYELIVTNLDNGCTASDQVIVTPDVDLPLAAAAPDSELACNNDMVNLSSSGSSTGTNIQYEWFDDTNTSLGLGATIEVGQSGTFTLVVTNLDNGCSSSNDALVLENFTAPNAVAGDPSVISCGATEATLDGSNSSTGTNIQYEWFDENGISVSNDIMINVDQVGTYELLVTNTLNGCTAVDQVVVTPDLNLPLAAAAPDSEITCNNDMVSLNSTGSSTGANIQYEWFDDTNTSLGLGATIEVGQSGTFTLVVTNLDNGCSASNDALVLQDLTAPIALSGNSGLITCAATEATLDGSNSSTGTNINYQWFDGNGVFISNDIIINVDQIGTYELLVTNTENGCTASEEVDVTEDLNPPLATAIANSELTCSNGMVNLSSNGSSTGTNIQYEWFDDTNTSIGLASAIDIGQSGTFILVVTNLDNGCSADNQVIVFEDFASPNANAGDPAQISCGTTEATLDGSNSSTGTNINYQWLDENGVLVSNDIIINVDQTGTYDLIVTNLDNGCTAIDQVIITPDTNLPLAAALADSEITCMNDMVSLNSTGSSTGMNIQYEWFDDTNTSLGLASTIEVSQSGTYTLLVTNLDNGCSASNDVLVLEDLASPVAEAGNSAEISCGATEVSLDGSASSNGANINYEWFDENGISVGNDITINVDQVGTYELVVMNLDNGCVASDQVIVTPDVNLPLAVAAPDSELACNNDMVSLSANGSSTGANMQYEWFDDTNTSLGLTSTIDVNQSGVYTLVVTNLDNGCSSSNNALVMENFVAPIALAGNPGMITCAAAEATLDGSNSSTVGNIVYQWTDENGTVISNDIVINVDEVGTYELLVTDLDNGCTAIDQVVVTPDTNLPLAAAIADSELACNNDMVSLSSNGSSTGMNIQYEWFDDTNTSLGIAATIDVLQSGTYTLVVTNLDNGCSADNQVLVLDDFAAPMADAGNPAEISCGATEAALDGSNSSTGTNINYQWFDENGILVSNNIMVNVDQVGTYELLVTNLDNGCTASDQVVVTPDVNLPLAVAQPDSELTCDNGMVNLSANGSSTGMNIQYEWFDDTNTSLGMGANIDVSQSGTYTLLVTNLDNGCSSSNDALVLEDFVAPTADAGNPAEISCGATEASLDGSASSTGTNISYQWLDENGIPLSNDVMIDVDQIGTYDLIVTNLDNGCTAIDQVIVTPDVNLPLAVAVPDSELNCNNDMVSLSATGSTAGTNIQYEWFDDTNTSLGISPSIDVNQSGIYTLVVTNMDNGCSASNDALVLEDFVAPAAEAGNPTTINCDDTETTLDGSNSSIGTNISYQWSDQDGNILSNSLTLLVDQSGLYQLLVTNLDNGCTSNDFVEIQEDFNSPLADPGEDAQINCFNPSTILSGSNSGSNLDFVWYDSNNNIIGSGVDVEVDYPGNFTLVVTNPDNGCTTSSAVNVFADFAAPTAAIDTDVIFDCSTIALDLDASGSSVGSNFTYQWTGNGIVSGANTLSPTIEIADIYNLTVFNTDNGCSSSAQISVDAVENAPLALIDFESPKCFGETGSLTFTEVSSGTPPFQYSINGGQSFNSQSFYGALPPGNYDLVVEDAIGCTYSENVLIDQPSELLIELDTEANVLLGDTYQLDAFVNMPSMIDTVIWSPAQGLSCTDCLDPVADITETQEYTVMVRTTEDCMAEAKIQLRVKKDRAVYIPNTFSPNNADGDNDVFEIYVNSAQVAKVNTFRVFNRWGALLHEAQNFLPNDRDSAWDGKHKGETLNPGVFVYIFEVEFIDGHVELYKGDITLL